MHHAVRIAPRLAFDEQRAGARGQRSDQRPAVRAGAGVGEGGGARGALGVSGGAGRRGGRRKMLNPDTAGAGRMDASIRVSRYRPG